MNEIVKSVAAPAPTRNMMVVGVGGQGVLLISKALALIASKQGHQVKQSEVHGMAKRGGVVFSHVRFGETVWSPTIAKGEADVIIALEWAEALRWLDFLRPETGVFIADTRRIVPPFACRDRRQGAVTRYAQETPSQVAEAVGEAYAFDATSIAAELGEPRAANSVLLGVLSTTMDIAVDDWLASLDQLTPARARDINREAFKAGRVWGEAAHADPTLRFDKSAPAAPLVAPAAGTVSISIDQAWCKSCDICVKVCPERCLALDAEHLAYVKSPQSCTGCRICEWLCPDFAISVRTEAAA